MAVTRFLKILVTALTPGTFAAPRVGMGVTYAVTGDGIGTMEVSPTAAPAGPTGNAHVFTYTNASGRPVCIG